MRNFRPNPTARNDPGSDDPSSNSVEAGFRQPGPPAPTTPSSTNTGSGSDPESPRPGSSNDTLFDIASIKSDRSTQTDDEDEPTVSADFRTAQVDGQETQSVSIDLNLINEADQRPSPAANRLPENANVNQTGINLAGNYSSLIDYCLKLSKAYLQFR